MPLKIIDENIELLMDTYAIRLLYYAGRLCSCIAENGGRPRAECGCDLGYWYENAYEEVYGIRTNYSYQFVNSSEGRIYNGGARFTIPKYYNNKEQLVYSKITHGDIIVVPSKVRRETEILRKGIKDKLYSFDVKNVWSVSKEGIVYRPQIDYVLDDRQIIWVGNSPNEGEYYIVEYSCSQQFKVWDVGANSRGGDNENLPIVLNTVIRRFTENAEGNSIDDIVIPEKIF